MFEDVFVTDILPGDTVVRGRHYGLVISSIAHGAGSPVIVSVQVLVKGEIQTFYDYHTTIWTRLVI
jgi:hypothetical protein